MLGPDSMAIYRRHCKPIGGWFGPLSAYLFGACDELQRRRSITGHLYEIGVHHGRSAALLGHLRREGERLGVCDVFDDQASNKDKSGKGDRAIFEANMRRVFGALPDWLRVHQKRSDQLAVDEIAPCRLFHVDGSHAADVALADLRLAERTLTPGGVVIMYDFCNAMFPGVAEAVHRYLFEGGRLRPFVLDTAKLYLTTPDVADAYRTDPLIANWRSFIAPGTYAVRQTELGGHPVQTFAATNRVGSRFLMEHPGVARLAKRLTGGR